MNLKAASGILKKYQASRSGLISILHDVQEEYGYLPEEVLRLISKKRNRPLIDIYRVAAFYSSFRFRPKGKHLLQICLGTACHVRGGSQVAEELGKKLGVEPGGTSKDGEFTFETVNCLGCCAIGPVVVKDDKYHGQVRIRDIGSLLMNEKFNGHKKPRSKK